MSRARPPPRSCRHRSRRPPARARGALPDAAARATAGRRRATRRAQPPLSPLSAALLAGIATVAGGTLLAAWRRTVAAGLWAQAAGMAAVGGAGAASLLAGASAGDRFTGRIGPAVGLDPLSGLFLAIVALGAVPAAAAATAALRGAPGRRPLAALIGLFHLALVGVLVARDVTVFLACWELMTLAPAAAILVARPGARARRAVFEYLAITHLGGAGVWVAMLALAERGALDGPDGLAGAGGGAQVLVGVAGLVGFGTKAGLVPLHAWLPRAHPLAPAVVSAVMSGVMVKVALYGLARLTLEWLGVPPAWLGLALVAVGSASALAGVLYALVQPDLKRLLAFSTIENAGVVAAGLGATALLSARGDDAWASLALAGALLHALAHTAAKALAFLGAGSIERAAGTLRLDAMGGLLRRLPWTGSAVLVGALTLAGAPVLAMFASEWLTVQALLGLTREGGPGTAMAAGAAVAALGAAIGLGAMCFAKVVGLVLLGRPRTPACGRAQEPPAPMRAAVVALAAACVALGLVPGLLLPSLTALMPGATPAATAPGLAVPGSTLPTLGLALGLAGAVALAGAVRGRRAARPAEVWACGQPVEPPLAWTSAGFGAPVRLALARLLRPRGGVEATDRGGLLQRVRYEAEVPRLLDAVLYRPVLRSALAGAAAARRLQSGSLRLYVAYLAGLVVALLVLARAGALG